MYEVNQVKLECKQFKLVTQNKYISNKSSGKIFLKSDITVCLDLLSFYNVIKMYFTGWI